MLRVSPDEQTLVVIRSIYKRPFDNNSLESDSSYVENCCGCFVPGTTEEQPRCFVVLSIEDVERALERQIDNGMLRIFRVRTVKNFTGQFHSGPRGPGENGRELLVTMLKFFLWWPRSTAKLYSAIKISA